MHVSPYNEDNRISHGGLDAVPLGSIFDVRTGDTLPVTIQPSQVIDAAFDRRPMREF